MCSAPVTVVSSGVVPAVLACPSDGVAEVSQAIAAAGGALGEVVVAGLTLLALPARHLGTTRTLARDHIAALGRGAHGLTVTAWENKHALAC